MLTGGSTCFDEIKENHEDIFFSIMKSTSVPCMPCLSRRNIPTYFTVKEQNNTASCYRKNLTKELKEKYSHIICSSFQLKNFHKLFYFFTAMLVIFCKISLNMFGTLMDVIN
jgi:hypothetical protein